MAWKCPQCKQINKNELHKCGCGYAYYEVLGLAEDASAQAVEQTYKYLIKVWKTPAEAYNAGSRGKLDERVNRINDAYAVFREIAGRADSGEKTGRTLQVAIGAGVAVLIVAVGAFFFSNQKAVQPPVASVSSPEQVAASGNSATTLPAQSAQGQPSVQQPLPGGKSDAPDMSADRTPEWAIEAVRKSRALDHSVSVEALVTKWTKENAEKLRVIGWLAKKVEDKTYLVTYTATDGIMPTGFYFEIDIETGEIRNIASSTELQQKYGIKQN